MPHSMSVEDEVVISSPVLHPPETDPLTMAITYWTEAGFGIRLTPNSERSVSAAVVRRIVACDSKSDTLSQLLEYSKLYKRPLTEREVEVLALLCEGKSNKEIAKCLILSARTVQVHLSNIYGKLGVSTRTEALIVAAHLGLAPQPATLYPRAKQLA